MNRLAVTVLGIVAAVGASGIVFIGINKLFDLTEDRYPLYGGIAGGILSGGVFALLWGNRMLQSPVAVTIAAVILGAAIGFALGTLEQSTQRLAAGIAGGVALGLLLGFSAQETVWPSLDPIKIIIGLLIGTGLGFLLWVSGGRQQSMMVSRLSAGAAIGWLLGAWVATTLDGSRAEVIVVAVVLGGLMGVALGGRPHPDQKERGDRRRKPQVHLPRTCTGFRVRSPRDSIGPNHLARLPHRQPQGAHVDRTQQLHGAVDRSRDDQFRQLRRNYREQALLGRCLAARLGSGHRQMARAPRG